MTDDIDHLTKLVDLMVSRRVRRVRIDAIDIELDPLAFAPQKQPNQPGQPAPFEDGPPLDEECSCGHADYEHDHEGLCLQGCAASNCVRKPA